MCSIGVGPANTAACISWMILSFTLSLTTTLNLQLIPSTIILHNILQILKIFYYTKFLENGCTAQRSTNLLVSQHTSIYNCQPQQYLTQSEKNVTNVLHATDSRSLCQWFKVLNCNWEFSFWIWSITQPHRLDECNCCDPPNIFLDQLLDPHLQSKALCYLYIYYHGDKWFMILSTNTVRS